MCIRWNYNQPGWIALQIIQQVREDALLNDYSAKLYWMHMRIADYIISNNDDKSIEFVD